MKYKIFIIILTFNNEKTIGDLLESVNPLVGIFKVVVCDNNSKDETISRVKKFKFVKIIKNKENLGYAGGNNVGIKYALKNGADFVFILNPDTLLKNDFLTNFRENTSLLLENNKIGIIGPKIYDNEGKIWSVGGRVDKERYSAYLVGYGKDDMGQYNVDNNIDYVSGTAIIVRKDVFEKIGLLREDYFLYYEDVDFCLRARKAGFGICIDPSITVIHKPSTSVGRDSDIMQYYLARNHLLFVERFAPVGIKIRELTRTPKTLYQARNKKYELLGLRDYFLRRFHKNDSWN